MQSVDNQNATLGRYERGVKRPAAALLAGIQELLAKDPSISKSEIARRLGVSRQTVLYAMRAMSVAVAIAAERDDAARHRLAVDHLTLIERVLATADEVRVDLGTLRKLPPAPGTASVVFRGYAVLNNVHRLLGELLGEISPPTTNVYLTRVEALLCQPTDPSTLSTTSRTALGSLLDAPASR